MTVRLSIATGDYDRIRPLREGVVIPQGVALEYSTLPSYEIFRRQVRSLEWDVSEMSLGSYLSLQSRGDNPFVAIPVFLSRMFRHGCIWVNTTRIGSNPAELRGKRIGVPDYHMTAAIWIRGMLEDDYGVAAGDVTWVVGGLNEPGSTQRLELRDIPGVRIDPAPAGTTLDALLVSGEIDAIVGALPPQSFTSRTAHVRRLFDDHVAAEQDYFRRHRIFPPMHCVAIRRPIYEENPWVAGALYTAFVEAKRRCLARLDSPGALPVMLPWLPDYLDEVRGVLGDDFWPYGVERNRHDLSTLARHAFSQGLLDREVSVDELFAPEVHDLAG